MKRFSILIFIYLIMILVFPISGCTKTQENITSVKNYIRVEKTQEKVLWEFKGLNDENTTEDNGIDFLQYVISEAQPLGLITVSDVDTGSYSELYTRLTLPSNYYGRVYTVNYKDLGWKLSSDLYILNGTKGKTFAEVGVPVILRCTGANNLCQSPSHQNIYCGVDWTDSQLKFYFIAENGLSCQITKDLEDCTNYWLFFGGKITVLETYYELVEVVE